MRINQIITVSKNLLQQMQGTCFEQLVLNKPGSIFEAINMMKIVSKVSPLVGNLFEIDAVERLRTEPSLSTLGEWIRQDPDFPDVVLDRSGEEKVGYEIKAWFPMSTEITGRFKDSQSAFLNNHIQVVLFAWLPEKILWGKPKILKVAIVEGKAIAEARDKHYHNPPDYLVIEPRDTSQRTRNLQQRNTNGYKWQSGNREEAESLVASWGNNGKIYSIAPEYQHKISDLQSRYTYRLDTNYAKIDRVIEGGVENFKTEVLQTSVEGLTISEWTRVFRSNSHDDIASVLRNRLGISN